MTITWVVVVVWLVGGGLHPERRYWTEFTCDVVEKNLQMELDAFGGGSYLLDCTEIQVAPWREQ